MTQMFRAETNDGSDEMHLNGFKLYIAYMQYDCFQTGFLKETRPLMVQQMLIETN